MAAVRRAAGVAFAVCVALVSEVPRAGAQAGRPRLVVHVIDYAGVRPVDLRATRVDVLHAFERIGVDVDWRLEERGAGAVPRRDEVTVLFLNESMQDAKVASAHLPAQTLGTASAAARRVYVFVARVMAVAAEAVVPVHEPLGQVITHELGHVLLPDGHGPSGIMRRELPRQGISSFNQFTAQQGASIRSVLMPRAPAPQRAVPLAPQVP